MEEGAGKILQGSYVCNWHCREQDFVWRTGKVMAQGERNSGGEEERGRAGKRGSGHAWESGEGKLAATT